MVLPRTYPPWLVSGSAVLVLILWATMFTLSFLNPGKWQLPPALNVLALSLLGLLHGLSNKGELP